MSQLNVMNSAVGNTSSFESALQLETVLMHGTLRYRDVMRPGDKVTWVQCDVCQLWFHFDCVGVDSISEHEDYMCNRCTEKRYASLVTAAQQNTVKLQAEFGTESASTDTSSGDEEYDEHMKEFYAESVDSYIIRSNRKSPASASSGGNLSVTYSDKIIVLE